MKKNYIVLFLAILFSGITIAQESQKNFINYQGVARNADNALMLSEEMTINIALKFGNAGTTSVYEESHAVTTDANGVFSLLIGNGSPAKGNYNTLPWGSAATFVTVSINGNEIGTTEMMAVPYALSAGNITDPSADEVLYDNTTSGLTATTTQDAIDELVTGGSVDADADPSNEFQTLSFDEGTNELSLSDGNSVVIPSGGTDADADPTNEIQTISFDAASNKISLTDGGEITIPSGGTDADADPANELQTLSFDAGTNELSLSDGNSIVIPTGGVDGDGDSTNELQTISFDVATNELSLSDGGTVTIPSGGTDGDADSTNEIQDISLAGTELTISDGSTIDLAPIIPAGGTDNQNLTFDGTTNILEIEDGNIVDLSSLAGTSGSSLWNEEATHIYANNRVGINTGAEIPKTLFEIAGVPGVSEDIGFTNALFTITDNEITGGPFQMVMGGKAIQTLAEGIPSDITLNLEGGDIGIGTFPTATLDVDGDARIRNLSGSGERNVVADANGNLVIGSDGAGSSLWTENFDKIFYDEGPVGIGTDNPERNTSLHIKGKMFLESPGGFYLGDPDFGDQWFINKNDGGAARNDLVFWSNSESDGRSYTSRIAMRREGELQIGRTGIIGSGWLNVIENSTLSKPHIKIQEYDEDYARLEFKNSSQGFWHIAGRGGDTGDVSRLNFYHHNGTVGRDYMTIAGSGNIGIGGSSPTARLHIFQGGQEIEKGLRFSDGINQDWTIAHGFGLSFYYGGNLRATIDPNNGAYIQVSDARLKSNIKTLSPVLEKVKQLRPSTYFYNSDEKQNTTVGLIAQDVQPLFPELVSSSGQERMLGIDYSTFSVVAIKAIQEQQTIIDKQSMIISNLEKRLKRLETKMGQ